MIIANGKLTMHEAAKQFVADHFNGREVGQWRGDCFQLVDGIKWYKCRMCSVGWDINETDRTPTPDR